MITMQWWVRGATWITVRDEHHLARHIAGLANAGERGCLQLHTVAGKRAVVVRTFGGFTVVREDVVGADVRYSLQSTMWILGAAKYAWDWIIPPKPEPKIAPRP